MGSDSSRFERPAMRLEDLYQPWFAQSFPSDGQDHIGQLFLPESRLPIVHQQESDGGVCPHSLVAVDKRMILAEMKQVCRRYSGNRGVKELPVERRLEVATADSSPAASRSPGDPPYRSICCSWISSISSSDRNTGSMKVAPQTHSASFRKVFPYRLCAHSWASSNFFRRLEGFAGAMIS